MTKSLLIACTATVLGLGALPAVAQSSNPTLEQSDLPTVREVLDRALEAQGGADRVAKIESTVTAMELTTPMGPVGMKMSWHKSGKVLIDQALPNNMGTITMGYDGNVGWMYNTMQGGYSLMPDEQLDQIKGQANILMVVSSFEKEFKKLEVVGRETFNEKPCVKVKLVDEKGEDGFAYFSTETGLIEGIESQEKGPAGPMTVTLRFAEWKELEGMRFFRKMVINNSGLDMEMNVKSIELNSLEESAFDLPEEVQALVAEKTPAPAASGEGG